MMMIIPKTDNMNNSEFSDKMVAKKGHLYVESERGSWHFREHNVEREHGEFDTHDKYWRHEGQRKDAYDLFNSVVQTVGGRWRYGKRKTFTWG